MDSHISCLRCAKRIPITKEMIGQTIVCPSCLDRVYVSAGDSAEKKQAAQQFDSASPAVKRGVDATAILQRNLAVPEEKSSGIGLAIGVGAIVVLVCVGAVIAYTLQPAKVPPTVVAQSNAVPLPPESNERPGRDAPRRQADDDDDEDEDDNARRRAKVAVAAPVVAAATSAAALSSSPAAESEPAKPAQPLPQPLLPGWAELWRLPPASGSELEEVLTPLAEVPQFLRVGLRSPDADLRMSPFVIEPEGPPTAAAWKLKRVLNPLAADGRVPLASLRRDGSNLVMAWATPDQELGEGPLVTNCVIEVHDNKSRRVGQLREPVRAVPIAFDVGSEPQTVETTVGNLPRMDSLRLEVLELKGFPPDAKIRGGARAFTTFTPPAPAATGTIGRSPLAAVAVPLVIEFAELKGLEIRLRCTADAAGKLAIAVEPVFQEGQDHDLRVPRLLDRLEAEARKPLPNAERELGPEENKLKTWQAKAKDQKGKEPPQNDFKRHSAWNNEHRKTLAKVAEFETNVKRYQQIVDSCQARLNAVTALRAFVETIEKNQPTIHFVVYSECGDPDLLLIDGRGQ